MATVYYLIEIYKKVEKGDGTYEFETIPKSKTVFPRAGVHRFSGKLFDSGLSFDSDKSVEATSDTFNFRITNEKMPSGIYRWQDGDIKQDDMVRIFITTQKELIKESSATGYMPVKWVDGGVEKTSYILANSTETDYYNSSVGSRTDYMKFDGNVGQLVCETGIDSGTVIAVNGRSRLGRMLDFTFPATYNGDTQVEILNGTDQDGTADNIIQNLIGHVNDDNQNYQITWASGNSSISSTNQTFISYFRNYRPIIEMISELSKQSINKSFNAYFYLDTDNSFVWKQKSKDTDTLELLEGRDFLTIKVTEKVWEVVNAVIVDCGKDPAQNNIHALYYEEGSANEFGLKWASTIEPKTEIATALIRDQKGLDGWVDNADENAQQFPGSTSYPLELTFKDRLGDGTQKADKITVSSDTEYVGAIRNECKWQGVDWAKIYLDFVGHMQPKVDITMNGVDWEMGAGRTGTSAEGCLDSSANPIRQGDLVKIKLLSRGEKSSWHPNNGGEGMRVVQVNHEISSKGWEVTLRLEMDVDDATDYEARRRIADAG